MICVCIYFVCVVCKLWGKKLWSVAMKNEGWEGADVSHGKKGKSGIKSVAYSYSPAAHFRFDNRKEITFYECQENSVFEI